MEDHSKANEQYLLNAGYILQLSQRAGELSESSKMEEKRQIMGLVLSNLQLEGKKLHFELKTPFDVFVGCKKNNNCLRIVDDVRTILATTTVGYTPT